MKKGKITVVITIAIACFALTTVMFMQFKIVNETDITSIETMKEEELRAELANWKQLYKEADEQYLERKQRLDEYKETQQSTEESTKLIEKELNQIDMYLGKTEVQGEGITITIKDINDDEEIPPISAEDLLVIVDYLKLAGAEAISINEQRIVNMSDIVYVNNSIIYVNQQRILENKNLLTQSEGALVVLVKEDTDTKEIPPLIYQKSNGAYLYATTDMATIYERMTKYNPDHIIYITDARQSLHFEQVFRASRLAGLTTNTDLKHLGYGTVNGNDGKPFKTRNGDALSLSELLDKVKETFIKTKESNQNMADDDLNIITNAIVKFADLQNNWARDYIFDIGKFSEVVGKTGPYILYTYLRVNKIIKSYDQVSENFNDKIYNGDDRNLRLKLLEFPIVINNAFENFMPSYLADYLYDICGLVNTFYQNNHLASLDDITIKNQWLNLLEQTNLLIKTILDLLVIKIPSKM